MDLCVRVRFYICILKILKLNRIQIPKKKIMQLVKTGHQDKPHFQPQFERPVKLSEGRHSSSVF
jgi:hypothetical protein